MSKNSNLHILNKIKKLFALCKNVEKFIVISRTPCCKSFYIEDSAYPYYWCKSCERVLPDDYSDLYRIKYNGNGTYICTHFNKLKLTHEEYYDQKHR